MAGGVGHQGHVGIVKEASYGGGSGDAYTWFPVTNASVGVTHNNVLTDIVRSTAEQVYTREANRVCTGSITFPVSPQGPLEPWHCSLGSGSGNAFYSILRPLTSFQVEVDQEQQCVQASGCMVSTLTVGSASGGELMASVDFEGKDMADCTVGVPTYTASDNPFTHNECVFKLDGNIVTNIQGWTITMNNNLVTDLFGNSLVRLDIVAGKLLVAGTFTKLFNDNVEYNNFLANDVSSFQATFSRGLRSWDLNIAKMKYMTRPSEITGQSDYISENFEFVGYIDSTTDYSAKLTVDRTG